MAERKRLINRWISEARALEIVGLARATALNWAKAGILERRVTYDLAALLELLLLAILREYLSVDDLARRWPQLRAEGWVADAVQRAAVAGKRCDLVVDRDHGGLVMAESDAELAAAVRRPGAPRAVTVVDIAPRIALIRQAFENWALVGPAPEERRPGRPTARRNGEGEVAA
jgi:hypothetical protein